MIKPDINSLMLQMQILIKAVATDWDVVLQPEDTDTYLPNSDKGVVFIGFRGMMLDESMSEQFIVQQGELVVQVTVMSFSIYGDNGILTLCQDILAALTATIVDANSGEKSYVTNLEQIGYDPKRGQWLYGLEVRIPVYVSE